MNNFSPAIRKILAENGFVFHRSGKGDHDIWINAKTGKRVTVDAKVKSRHTANKVMRDANLPKAF